MQNKHSFLDKNRGDLGGLYRVMESLEKKWGKGTAKEAWAHALKNTSNYNDKKAEENPKDKDASIHEDAEKIAKHAGISLKEYQGMHPDTKK